MKTEEIEPMLGEPMCLRYLMEKRREDENVIQGPRSAKHRSRQAASKR